MRLAKLHLELFGHFEDAQFDFGGSVSPKDSDFHVIYGPNEAGKSTLMEGYLRLLYGFPKRDQYAFMHQRQNLSVSGVMDSEGEHLFVRRVPTNEPSLRDEHGSPMLENAIQSYLHGLPQDDYRKLLCLNDDTIAEGGEEIINAKGEVGRLLFSSTSGISNLSTILDEIKSHTDALYKKRGTTSEFAGLKRDVKEIEGRIKEYEISQAEYKRLKQEHENAVKAENEITQKRKLFFKQQEELKNQIDAIPLIAEYKELDEKLTPFSDWPSHIEISSEMLVEKLTEFNQAEADSNRLANEIKTLSEELEKIIVNPLHIELIEKLDALDTLKSRYITANQDLDRRRGEREKVRIEIRTLMRKLGLSEKVEFSEVVLNSADLERLEKVKAEMEGAKLKVKTEGEERDKIVSKLSELKELFELHQESVPKEIDLTHVFEKYNIDKLITRYIGAQETIDSAEQQTKKTLVALNVKGTKFDSIPSCSTTIEEAEEYLENQKKISADLNADKLELETVDEQISESKGLIGSLIQSEGVLGNSEFQSLLEKRNELWRTHKSELTDGSATKFEKLMYEVDVATDKRQTNSEKLGQLTQLQQNLARLETKKQQLEERLKSKTKTLVDLDKKFLEIAKECKLPDTTRPIAIIAWLKKLEDATLANDELIRLREKHLEIFKQSEKLEVELQKCFPDSELDLEGLVEKARIEREKLRTYEEKSRGLKSQIDEKQIELKARTESFTKLEDIKSKVLSNWQNAIENLLPKKINAQQLEQSLVILNEIIGKHGSFEEFDHRIETMEKDQENFVKNVKELAQFENVELSEDILVSYEALHKIAESAATGKKRRMELEKQIATNQKEMTKTNLTLETIKRLVEEQAQQFPTDSPISSLEELREHTKKAEEIVVERNNMSAGKRKILSILEVESIEEACELLESQNLSDLKVKLLEINAELETIEIQYRDAIAHKSASETNLNKITGDAEVARLVEQKTTLGFQKRQVAVRHLKLYLGHKIAEEAIRRYRDEHRSAMLQTTEEAFIELTNKAYRSLQVQPIGNSESLIAIDSTGRSKNAEDLSKGTRFQLYLALRAAAYSQLVERKTCLPFFCDDVFETFDEERTRAACKLMHRIGKRGQAIYLTHHRHVVEIARETCGKNVKFHELTIKN